MAKAELLPQVWRLLGQFRLALETHFFCWWLRRLVKSCVLAPSLHALTYLQWVDCRSWCNGLTYLFQQFIQCTDRISGNNHNPNIDISTVYTSGMIRRCNVIGRHEVGLHFTFCWRVFVCLSCVAGGEWTEKFCNYSEQHECVVQRRTTWQLDWPPTHILFSSGQTINRSFRLVCLLPHFLSTANKQRIIPRSRPLLAFRDLLLNNIIAFRILSASQSVLFC